jgi:hypothetical protein
VRVVAGVLVMLTQVQEQVAQVLTEAVREETTSAHLELLVGSILAVEGVVMEL